MPLECTLIGHVLWPLDVVKVESGLGRNAIAICYFLTLISLPLVLYDSDSSLSCDNLRHMVFFFKPQTRFLAAI
jgi:hypothetical protein